jgi:hypothetical protein
MNDSSIRPSDGMLYMFILQQFTVRPASDVELLGLPFGEMAKSAPYRWVGGVIPRIICKSGTIARPNIDATLAELPEKNWIGKPPRISRALNPQISTLFRNKTGNIGSFREWALRPGTPDCCIKTGRDSEGVSANLAKVHRGRSFNNFFRILIVAGKHVI